MARFAAYHSSQDNEYPSGFIVIRWRDFNGEPTPITINGQADPQRLTNVMKLQIGSDLIPGDYVCQIIVTDGPDNSKPRVASQWIDFEIVKWLLRVGRHCIRVSVQETIEPIELPIQALNQMLRLART